MTLSPIYPTVTKPGYGPALGAGRAGGELAARRRCPWLALGGIDSPGGSRHVRAAGAAGVAVLGAVMRADDPARVAASWPRVRRRPRLASAAAGR